jgi:hypothetical protein
MSEIKPEVKPDDLTTTIEPAAIELKEEDLDQVSGGETYHGAMPGQPN